MSDPLAEELLRLRMSIDNMDAALVHLLAGGSRSLNKSVS